MPLLCNCLMRTICCENSLIGLFIIRSTFVTKISFKVALLFHKPSKDRIKQNRTPKKYKLYIKKEKTEQQRSTNSWSCHRNSRILVKILHPRLTICCEPFNKAATASESTCVCRVGMLREIANCIPMKTPHNSSRNALQWPRDLENPHDKMSSLQWLLNARNNY